MSDLIRDSTFAGIIRWISLNKSYPYPEQSKGYILPPRYQPRPTHTGTGTTADAATTATSNSTLLNADAICQQLPLNLLPSSTSTTSSPSSTTTTTPSATPTASIKAKAVSTDSVSLGHSALSRADQLILNAAAYQLELDTYRIDPYLVDFTPHDPDNPYNWSSRKRNFFTACISLLTFSVYIGSAIFTASIPGLIQDTGVSLVEATLGLSMFVFGYGVGPLLLAPLQETPAIGRTPVYIITLFLFVLFTLGTVFVNNLPGLVILRFLAGFVGSPALATGGASMSDVWSARLVPYAIGLWSLGAVSGPTLGPLIGGFPAEALGYRWPLIELLLLSSFTLIFLFFLFPETYGPSILYRRAARLRAATGDDRYKSPSELQNEGKTIMQEVRHNIVYTIKLCSEPAILFSNIYIGLVYSVFYLWFEAFPLVFNDIYHFSLGISGLPFLGFIVSGVLTYIVYAAYQYYYLQPHLDRNPSTPLEKRLELALYSSFTIPLSLLIFGWGSRADIHWIVPVIGAAIYLPGIYIAFQCILIYACDGYPGYSASILAGNDFFRSSSASIFPLFGTIFFQKVGLGQSCTILAVVSVVLIGALYLLMLKGPVLRAQSKYNQLTNLEKTSTEMEKSLAEVVV